MITTGAIIHGDAARYLAFNSEEHPIAVQLGGNDAMAVKVLVFVPTLVTMKST